LKSLGKRHHKCSQGGRASARRTDAHEAATQELEALINTKPWLELEFEDEDKEGSD